MSIINLGNEKVKILPDINKTLLDTRTGLKTDPVYCDKGEEKWYREVDL